MTQDFTKLDQSSCLPGMGSKYTGVSSILPIKALALGNLPFFLSLCTVVLTVAADGSMLLSIVIFKGKCCLKLTAPDGILILEQTKAWMTEEGVP